MNINISKEFTEYVDNLIADKLSKVQLFEKVKYYEYYVSVCRVWLSIPKLWENYNVYYDGVLVKDNPKMVLCECPDGIFPPHISLKFESKKSKSEKTVHYLAQPSMKAFIDSELDRLVFTKEDRNDFFDKLKITGRDLDKFDILNFF